MALGNNFKMDRLIPIHEETRTKTDSEIIQVTNAATESTVEAKNTEQKTGDKIETLQLNNFSIQFIPSKRKTTRRITLIIEGDFSINNIHAATNRLIEIIKNYDYLDFVLKNIRQLDITAIQLIYFLKSTDIFGPKHFTFQNELDRDQKTLLTKCGFDSLLANKNLTK